MALDLNAIVAAIVTILDTALTCTVIRSSAPNRDPGRCPWVGVYKTTETYRAYTIAAGHNPWRVDGEVEILAQEASLASGSDADTKLETLKAAIIAALEANLSLSNTVACLKGFDITYEYGAADTASVWYVQARIRPQWEARA